MSDIVQLGLAMGGRMPPNDDIEIVAEALYRAGWKRMGAEPIHQWRDPRSNICHDWFRMLAKHSIAAASVRARQQGEG